MSALYTPNVNNLESIVSTYIFIYASILCSLAACSERKVRITSNSTHGGSIRGRVEVCIGGRYGTICDDVWDAEDSSVVCNQIGFSPYGNILKLIFGLE